ncbi:HEXXH motif-containing protein [Actinomadura coerulea]|uniref:HEXXH motif-containing protein n=1 Tax=Actinomadura coerulea TaxID=46159 RepID=A0A7X0G022_9ACTN|nr:HEXXH motif domain-containing protein [Actinomadura coerulea]MBB6396923.1 HEXXH motif-containing protein [Actinomadura coerulea]GGP95355.1 HEXXH motif domain-containing protein [Actinomadura coerulea]
MNHSFSGTEFDSLASGMATSGAIESLGAIQHSRNLLLLRSVVDAAHRTGHPEAAAARHGFEQLMELKRRAPDAAAAVITHPSTGGWGLHALRVLRGGASPGDPPGARPAQLAGMAAAAAIRGRRAGTFTVPVSSGTVTLPSVGVLTAPQDAGTVRIVHDGREVVATAGRTSSAIPTDGTTDAPGWQGLRTLRAQPAGRAGFEILLDDVDPFRFPRVSSAGAERLSEGAVAELERTLGDAWELLSRHHRASARELSGTVSTLTPLRSSGDEFRSATSREHYGCVALSLPVIPTQLAVTLVHEAQHGKLAAITDAVRLLPGDDGRRYYAPWRPDPRPFSGLLHGTYAFLGVARFWRRQRWLERGEHALAAHLEYAHWREAVRLGLVQLCSRDRLPALTERFVHGMRHVLEQWRAEPVPGPAAALAAERSTAHREHWIAANGPLPGCLRTVRDLPDPVA